MLGVKNGMKKAACILVLACCATAAMADTPEFDKYQVILDRKPFGVAPPPESTAPAITERQQLSA